MPRVRPQRIVITIEDAEIPWQAVMDAIKIEPDEDMSEAPWDNCDGWNHTADRIDYLEHDPQRESDRFVCRSSREGGNVWLTLDVEKSGIATWDYFHAQGASKQVSRELAAQSLRQTYAQLHKWYADGWEWWAVSAELKGESASCGGIDSYEYADKEFRQEIASELAANLESAGFIVTGKPIDPPYRPQFANYKHSKHVNAFNVSKR